MFVRNIENLKKNTKIKTCEFTSNDKKDYLINNDIFPISSYINSDKETVWVFVDCKDTRNYLKGYKENK